MIYIELTSRIGNHLFQIATGASLAHQLGCDFVACPRHEMLNEPDHCLIPAYLEQFRNNILRDVKFVEEVPSNVEIFQETTYHYQPIPLKSPLFIKGYFQSPKYFNEPVVRKLFAIDDASLAHIKAQYGYLFTERFTSITVRRGDYLRIAHRLPVCSMRYFRAAMEHIPSDNKFLIISDDIEWCKQNFRGDRFYFVDDEPPLIDLYLQTLCTNNIISNSSFAWWGAWLNGNPDKKVVYPKRWFGRFRTEITTDLFPAEWVTVDNPTDFSVTVQAWYLEFLNRVRYKWSQWTTK